MRNFDFSSWQTILTSIAGLLLVTLIGMGIRLVMMMTIQQRRERQNRQINERLKALIAAYKVLGGSFTGNLTVSPAHLRDLKRAAPAGETPGAEDEPAPATQGSERARRVRDAVEAALSDIVLFGTEAQVELAATAMRDMVAGRPVEVAALVVSLRAYIREVLDLDPIPASTIIPAQGPTRPSGSGGGRREGGGEGRGGGGGSGGAGAAMGMGMGGMAMGGGMVLAGDAEETQEPKVGSGG